MKNTITMAIKNCVLLVCCTCIMVTSFSCKKYLDKKPTQNMVIPESLADLQAVMDNQNINDATSSLFLEIVSDNYYLTTTSWQGLHQDFSKTYIWDKDAKITLNNGGWSAPYEGVYYANFVLDLLPKVKYDESEQADYNYIKGTALFVRAFLFHELTQLYCKPYSAEAANEPGIVLRMTPEVDAPIARSTVQQTYDQIINDIKAAIDLLPLTNSNVMRPGKAAAYGLLSRVYLTMRDFENAERAVNSTLSINSSLLDYNSLTPVSNPVLPNNPLTNPEILFINVATPTIFNNSHIAIVDSVLYKSYDGNDLRKTVYYGLTGANPYWKGSYYANGTEYGIFNGIATDELYLIRAECRARSGNITGAMDDLNALLKKRWKTGTFTNITAINSNDALNKVLVERRKELAFRGLRWSDLRRYNLDGNGITLKRIVNNTEYTLPPNDLRWVLLIPEVEINRSGIQQNPR
jgi:starch-binding outer membrane protein, SusD/RagB family